MKTKSLHTLMQKALDGTLNDSEKQIWQSHLQQHPEARELFDEQVEMTNLLQTLEEVQPPDHLPSAIMHRIRSKSTHCRTWRTRLADLRLQNIFSRPAYSFAAGLTLGLLLLVATLQINTLHQADNTLVSGTIGALPGEHHVESIVQDNIQGQIHWITQPDRIEVQLKLVPNAPVTIQFKQLHDNMTLTGFRGIKLREIQDLNLTPDKLEFAVVKPCNLTLDFSSGEAGPSPFQLQIFQLGQLCYQKVIE